MTINSGEKIRQSSRLGLNDKEKSHCMEGDLYVAAKKVKPENLPETEKTSIQFFEDQKSIKNSGAVEFHKNYLAKVE